MHLTFGLNIGSQFDMQGDRLNLTLQEQKFILHIINVYTHNDWRLFFADSH